ncbi:hypothetical protein [Natrinema salaciae]|uniref:Uncharacterized protein n=1 Tax=Natrinema salaciae TaxID=1186196 RepID=A0A1H8ZLR6_9EURY|nr:hypothetical protein [Natrinema salaciae]SEP65183.1 hypothetical protein SAMN04489841_0203 [Natrinema salaciae]
MSSDGARSWTEKRKTTNLLLGTNIVVLAAGFTVVGNVGSPSAQAISKLILLLVLLTAVVLVVGALLRNG